MPTSLQKLNSKRKATHKLKAMGCDPAKIVKEKISGTFSEKNAHKATSCTKMRREKYGIENQPEKVVKLEKMPRKMKKQVKKELLAA